MTSKRTNNSTDQKKNLLTICVASWYIVNDM